MIGGEPPLNRTELVTELVNEMYSYNDKLPMIVIDVPASDLSVLEVALRDAHSSLERLNALLVLVCDIKERHHLPSAVVDGFELFRLPPLTANDVMALVQQRLASVGVMDSAFTMQDAATILDECDGYPASVITILRDAVDSIRMRQSNGSPSPYLDTSARIQPRDEPERLHRLMGNVEEAATGHETATHEPSVDDGGSSAIVAEQTINEPVVGGETGQAPSDVIDASVPWDQRPPLSGSTEVGSSDDAPPALAGFELDMDRLNEEQEKDEPLQANPLNPPIIDADQALGGRTPIHGMFKGLASRNKDANTATESGDEEEEPHSQELIAKSMEFEYWVAEDLLPPTSPEDIPEEESAMLLHDEIGMLDEAEEEVSTVGFNETPVHLMKPAEAEPLTNQAVLSVLADLLSTSSSTPNAHHEGLLAFLQSRIRERTGPNESYALNKHLLGSLNSNESYVVALAHQRAYSPSDVDMLAHMNIKRARLSQISNRLLKHGILQARQVGRSRKYSLTQAARAQLMAWGAISGGEVQ
ncbi:MAG: hypothetical protein CL972_02845 [Euryarchaeota archaeon]|nr:hypothetical protein [Euryarchaeota archaeon]